MIHSYRDLLVWERSVELVVAVYEFTEKFPKEETYGLAIQMRRAATSIPSNIAEGRYRGTRKDFMQFVRVAYASGAELETQLEIAKRLPKTKWLDHGKVDQLLGEVMRMLNVMLVKLDTNKPKS